AAVARPSSGCRSLTAPPPNRSPCRRRSFPRNSVAHREELRSVLPFVNREPVLRCALPPGRHRRHFQLPSTGRWLITGRATTAIRAGAVLSPWQPAGLLSLAGWHSAGSDFPAAARARARPRFRGGGPSTFQSID